MKKMMVIAVAIMAAVAANAAAFSWKTSTTGKVYEPGSTTATISGMAYLFDAGTVTKASIVEAFASGSLDLTKLSKIDNTSVADGKIAAKTFSDGTEAGSYLNSYFAVLANVQGTEMLYISTDVSALAVEGKTANIQFNEKNSSQLAAMDASSGYSTAGWYQAVPEPTSGLLMLLGMAGLALRRRRA